MTSDNNQIHNCMKINKYLKKHPGIYDGYQERYIRDLASAGPTDRNIENDLVREILDELDMIPDDKNLYLDFLRVIEQVHPDLKDKYIVEIGSGILPRLGERIEKKLDKGRIVLFDPLISKYKKGSDKLIIKRQQAKVDDRTINWDDVDLLVALKPCAGADSLIELAATYGIDFVLGLCEGGPHGDVYDFYESDDEWISSIIHYAKREVEDKGLGQLVKTKLDKPYYDYPIIYNRRKK